MTTAKKVLRGTAWMALFGYIHILVSFGGNVILAHILVPNDFGVFTLASSLLSFIFILAGFGSQEAIVQCHDDKIQDLIPTAFWISIFIGLFIAILGTLIGFLLQNLYDDLTIKLIIILSWMNIFSILGVTYSSILIREQSYKIVALVNPVSSVISYTIAIIVAQQTAGPWVLVVRQTVAAGIVLIAIMWASHYRLTFDFNWKTARWIWDFGWRVMITRISEVIFGRLDNLIIGTTMGTVALGHYSLAYRLAWLGQQFTQMPLQKVMFSTFSNIQKSSEKLSYGFERVNYWLWRIVIPLGMIVLVMGKNLVILLYGDQWELAGTVFQSLFLFLILLPLQQNYNEFLIGSGHVNTVAKTYVIYLLFFIPGLMVAAYWGELSAFVWVVNISVFLNCFLMARAIGKVVLVDWIYLIKAPIASGIVATVVGASINFVDVSRFNLLALLLAQGIIITVTYCIVLYLVNRAALLDEWHIIRAVITKGS